MRFVSDIKKRMIAVIISGAMILAITGCSGNSTGSTGDSQIPDGYNGELNEQTENGITVTLATDKSTVKKGETIGYSLTVTNNRAGYTVSMVSVEATNDDNIGESGGPSFSGQILTGDSASYEGTVIAYPETPLTPTSGAKLALSGDIEKVTLRPYVKINCDGEELMIRYIVEVIMFQQRVEIDAADKVTLKTVSCHDPSIVVGEDKEGKKCYYIFGSHRAWAKSYDLQNWSSFSNNLSTDYRNLLEEPAAWSAHGSKNYKVDGYMWAPDVIYNTAMGKWCMYLSVDGDNWYSSIVLLTADTIEGDWTYEGMVVMSGFHSDEFYDETDVAEVTGETEYPERYNKGKKWGDYYPNNIDACVFYDDEGNLWMTYGSWSGGIFMLELDEQTGFRDMSVSYADNIHSDPYFGKKIAGGAYASGEASYIQKIGDYYWLFMCYGGLEAKGGYNVRVFRSERPDGDYVDELDNTPYFDNWVQNFNIPVGVRLFGGYKWRTFTQGQVAQGHNSAFVDDDGKAYIVFHTRTTDGSEGHYVKVHQLFLNKDGWLVAAPYQTSGETLKEDGYSVSEVAGTYDVIMHELNIDYANLDVNKPSAIELKEDGSITGDYEGSWSLEEGTPYIDITIGGETYSGLTLEMNVEGTSINTMTFTALGKGNQITFWGSKSIAE
ncbi:MAG: glycoside hydrolase family 43 protein [Lachnospiraceae bacterium]|nr:glycoside hydrolase family 43 protein [Lachnospiraceae bacterium]